MATRETDGARWERHEKRDKPRYKEGPRDMVIFVRYNEVSLSGYFSKCFTTAGVKISFLIPRTLFSIEVHYIEVRLF